MGRFAFNDMAHLAAVENRKVGKGDNRELVVHVKLVAVTGMAIPDYLDPSLRSFLWTPTGGVRNKNIKAVAVTGSIGGCTAELCGLTFGSVKAGKFSVEALDEWRARVGMTLTFRPDSKPYAQILERLDEQTLVKVLGEPVLDDGDDAQQQQPAAPPAPPLTPIEALAAAASGGADDPAMEQAIAVVREHKRASISLLQRRLAIGYNRAARMMEAMEKQGLVSAMDTKGNREVLA